MARPAAAGADPAGTGGAAGRGTDPGEAQPGLTAAGATAAGPRGGTARSRRVFGSLRNRNYRLFAIGQVVSNTGTWMQRVAQDWLVLELTHGNAAALGITAGLQFLPLLAFSLWGGTVADRYAKRRILAVTQTGMGALALVLGLLTLTRIVTLWDVYALAFGLGLFTVVDNPTRQAFVVEMVGRADLPNAIALNSAIFNLARIAGPALAGLVISVVGTPVAFIVNAASYGALLLGLKLMRPAELRPAERVHRTKGQVREALAYVRARPRLWLPLVLVFFVATFGMNFQVTTALMSRLTFHTGAGAFGLASTVFAVGALAGALAAARRRSPGLRVLLLTAGLFGLLEVVTGLMPTYWSFLALLVPTGLTLLLFTTCANSATQLSTAPEMRGRVMGLYQLVFFGGTPLGSPLAGWLAGVAGPRMSVVAGGLISAAAAAAAGTALAHRGGPRVRDRLRPRALFHLT